MSNKKPQRGTTSQFDALHGALTETFTKELERCRAAGEAPSPQFLAQLRQFLDSNGINVPAHDSRFDRLKGEIPDMDTLEKGLNVVPIKQGA